MTSDNALSGDYGDQLIIAEMGPMAGDRFQNIHSGYFATVTMVYESRHRIMVEYRQSDRLSSMAWEDFQGHWKPTTDTRDLR